MLANVSFEFGCRNSHITHIVFVVSHGVVWEFLGVIVEVQIDVVLEDKDLWSKRGEVERRP